MLELAEQTGLGPLLEQVRFRGSKVRSRAVDPAGKLECVIAGMATGADPKAATTSASTSSPEAA